MSSPALKRGTSDRIVAIDALRGFDMFWICGGQPIVLALSALIFMKFPGVQQTIDHQLGHVPWGERLVFWDLIMPLFLFIVGASMPFSFTRRLESGQGKADLYKKILTRVAILWVLGMIKQGDLLHFDPSKLRLYSNTLQAIAAGYLIGGIVMLNTGIRGQIGATAGLLLLYWGLLALVPFAGNPGGTIEDKINLAEHIDATLFGAFNDKSSYTWGLSSLGFAGTTLLGILSGHILRSDREAWTRLKLLAGVGVGLILLGEAWNFVLPINKYIWTSSMTVWTAGWCYLLLALFYLLFDIYDNRKLAFPFIVIGANALVAYMSSFFIRFDDIAALLFHGEQRMGVTGNVLQTFAAFMLLWGALYWMYRRKIFVKI